MDSLHGQQATTETFEQQGPRSNNTNTVLNNNDDVNSSTDYSMQYVLVGDGRHEPPDHAEEQIWQLQRQGLLPPPPPPQSEGNWPQDQSQQSDPYGDHLHRSRTCPALDHDAVHNLESDGRGYSTSHPLDPGRLHGERRVEEPWDESRASCYGKARHRIGEAIETRTAHIVILSLTVVDIILVMLQIGASLLHLDETKEEIWYIALFGHLSLAIVSMFMLEILFKFFAFGPRYFMPGTRHWFLHLIDALIILTSFLLEIFLRGTAEELSSLLIMFRLWRVIKLTGTVAIEVSEHDEQKVASLEQRVAELEQELQESRLQVQRLEAFNRGGYQGETHTAVDTLNPL
ncbi:hypothetical protein BGZ83_007066 [Gryganskiella cystojenkinii]|nr:hypothetical protein BGZ83_007066 [Gryganskiella cystojenkinii]